MKNTKPISVQIMLALVFLSLSASAAAPAFRGKFTFKDVIAPGATETDSYAIDDDGAITGDYIDTSGVQHEMILKGKTLMSIDNTNCIRNLVLRYQCSPGACRLVHRVLGYTDWFYLC